MPIKKTFAAEQVQRLMGLPFASAVPESGIRELFLALADEADTEHMAEAAVSNLLADASRASSPELNRVPSPGELRAWVRAEKEKRNIWQPPPKPDFCIRCGGDGRVLGEVRQVPWNLPTAEIEAFLEASKVPCPECAV